MRALHILVALSAASFLVASPAAAQEYATVRDIEGNAFVQAFDEEEPQPLTINTPLTDGDSIWTASGGKLGIMLLDGNRLWLDESSRLEAEQFPGADASGERTLSARLWKGTLLLEVGNWNGLPKAFGLVTPSAVVSVREEGLFLVQIDTVDRTRVISLRGRCFVASGGATVELDTQQTTYAEYGYAPLQPASADLGQPIGLVEFRNLCQRSKKAPPSGGKSSQYLGADLEAYAGDLDQNGYWTTIEGYGDCWVPYDQGSDWAPYTNGRWTYTTWGLTWVPFEVWGWVPFHYGGWCFSAGFGWAWYPGSAFAPAWCSWYWGPGWLGWCPLDPWGYPLWSHCGWYSCDFGGIYRPNLTVVRHRTAPPPDPIYPRPNAKPGRTTARPGEPRVGTATPGARNPATGLDLKPRKVRDYTSGRITSDALRAQAMRPPSRAAVPGVTARPKPTDGGSDGTRTRTGTRDAGTVRNPRSGGADAYRAPSREPADRGAWRPSEGSSGGEVTRRSEPDRTNPRKYRQENPHGGYAPRQTGRPSDRDDPSANYRPQRPDDSLRSPSRDRGRGGDGYGQSGRRSTPGDASPRYGNPDRSQRPRGDGSRAIPSRPAPPVNPSGGSGVRSGQPRSSPPPKASPPPSRGNSSPPRSSGSTSGSSGSGKNRKNR